MNLPPKHPIISLYGDTEALRFPLILVIGREPNDDLKMGDEVGPYDFMKAPHTGVWNTAYKLVASSRGMSIARFKKLCRNRGNSVLAFADVSPFTIPNGVKNKAEIRSRYGTEDYVKHVKDIMVKKVFGRVQMVILSGLENSRYIGAVKEIEGECASQEKSLVKSVFFTMNRRGGWERIRANFSQKELGLVGRILDDWMRITEGNAQTRQGG